MALPALELAAPWLAPYRTLARSFQARCAAGASVAEALDTPGAPRRFVPPSALRAGQAYESFVAETGAVPTRDNLHDFFNGLLWHAEPRLKARLNTLQAQAIAEHGVGPRRGPVRDALTLFDENGVLLLAPDALVQALRARRWQALFVELRPLWQQARVQVIGHALLEALTLAPRKALSAHVLLGDSESAAALSASQWAAKPFLPLPVLGIPGWWPANEHPAYYADDGVFRPAPQRPAGHGTAATNPPAPAGPAGPLP